MNDNHLTCSWASSSFFFSMTDMVASLWWCCIYSGSVTRTHASVRMLLWSSHQLTGIDQEPGPGGVWRRTEDSHSGPQPPHQQMTTFSPEPVRWHLHTYHFHWHWLVFHWNEEVYWYITATNFIRRSLDLYCYILLHIAFKCDIDVWIISQTMMKLNPMKSPRTPPQSATRDPIEYASSSFSVRMDGLSKLNLTTKTN